MGTGRVMGVEAGGKFHPGNHLVGRNGMHQYNNQDHSVLIGLLAARNILGGGHDLWAVNAADEYHEMGSEITDEEFWDFAEPTGGSAGDRREPELQLLSNGMNCIVR